MTWAQRIGFKDKPLEEQVAILYRQASPFGVYCAMCDHKLYTGKQKCFGMYVLEDGDAYDVCTICLQADLSMNKEYLHTDHPANAHKEDTENSCISIDKKDIRGWDVLDKEPWLKSFGKFVEGKRVT